MGGKGVSGTDRGKTVVTGMPVRQAIPKATSEAVSRSMRGNKSKGTYPELLLARLVWESGLRGYRKNDPRIPGKPDLYFPRLRLAVLLNGCFWHRCPYCRLPMPKSNVGFWEAKFARNKERDALQKKSRDKLGIKSLVIWECQLKKDPGRVVDKINALIRIRREDLPSR